jgi:hypothetical protein
MAQAGSRCGTRIASTQETALRSAGAWSTSAAAEHRRVTPRPSELPGGRATPHSAEISDGAARLAELRLRAVRRAARQRRGRRRARSPTRACSRSRRRPRGRGAMRARTAGTATGSGRSRRPCATRREGRSPRSSPAATRQVRRSRNRIRYRNTAPVVGRIRASWTSCSRLSLRTTRIRAATPSCRGALHSQGVGGPASRAALPLTASAFAIACLR